MVRARLSSRRPTDVLAVALVATALVLAGTSNQPATADVSGITASAFGYQTNIGFNGGPPTVRGFGQTMPPGTAESASPSVSCPSSGSPLTTVTDPDGARATYGSAVFFGGRQPENATEPPPSGPLTVSCQGSTGPAGSASSSADVYNVGPRPLLADEVHSTCTATETGVSGTTTIFGGVLVTSTDADGRPVTTEAVPIEPPVNYTRAGAMNDVGDSFRAVFNEQIVNPDGSLTVNAVHVYFLGPFAEGELIIGQSVCGVAVTHATTTTSGAPTTTTTAAPTTTTTAPPTTTTTAAPTTTTTAAPTTTTTAATTTTGGQTTTTLGSPTTVVQTTTTVGPTPTTAACKPGHGRGDKNHCHSGPPGQQGRTPRGGGGGQAAAGQPVASERSVAPPWLVGTLLLVALLLFIAPPQRTHLFKGRDRNPS